MGTALSPLTITKPRPADGREIWELVKMTGILDVNSVYLYLVICRDFAETSVIVREGDDLVGVITGYSPPAQPDTLFVWQVAVHERMRGQGLASRMLDHLVARAGSGLSYVETTVSPSNEASRRMFESLAKRHGTQIRDGEGFPESLFPDDGHEAEPRLIIGPFKQEK